MMENYLVIDVETTTHNKGNAFDTRNHLVCTGWASADAPAQACLGIPENMQKLVDDAKIIVGFNFKFDYHWLRKNGIKLVGKRIWDCQLAEYVFSKQQYKMPSLDGCLELYGLPPKDDVVRTQYWDKGICTSQIPWDILSKYQTIDILRTEDLAIMQYAKATDAQRRLVFLMGHDMHVLQEMEWNGETLDVELCETEAARVTDRMRELEKKIAVVTQGVPINLNSGDQLSALLYGGIVKEDCKEHIGFYKTGVKKGQPKYQNYIREHQLPRLVEPLKGSELAKEGYYKTSTDILRKLKVKGQTKKLIESLLELSALEKLLSTYYGKMPQLLDEMHWSDNTIHGQLNQCLTVTGRLSSSKPNKQNYATACLNILRSRYETEV